MTTPKNKFRLSINPYASNQNNPKNRFSNVQKNPFEVNPNTEKKGKKGRRFSKNNKYSDFLNNINKIIEGYQEEFTKGMGKHVFTPLASKLVDKVKEYYQKKVENFDSYEDQIKELNMMIDGNDNEANDTINLMIKNLLIDKNSNEDQIKKELENNLEKLVNEEKDKFSNKFFEGSEYFDQINKELKNKIQNL